MRFAPAILRGVFLLLLGGAFFMPPPAETNTRGAGVVRLPQMGFDAASPGPIIDSLLTGPPAAVAVRSSPTAPSQTELDLLAAIAARTPLLVSLADTPQLLHLEPPFAPRAERVTAIAFRLSGIPGDSVLVRLRDATGPLDSMRVAADGAGNIAAAFRVRPARRGWQEWFIEAAGARQQTGTWVAEAAPVRVLVIAGPPTWESRFVVRALEEGGVRVDLIQPLGRGLRVGEAAVTVPSAAGELDRYDAVLLLEDADVSASQLRNLEQWVSARGGGVLGVDAAAAAEFQVGTPGPLVEVEADELRWSLPAELVPLPPAGVRSTAQPLVSIAPGGVVASSSGPGALLTLRPLGRGRVAAMGLTETWRWRMQAGQVAEHREFWRSIVEWLSGGARQGPWVQLATAVGPVGTAIAVEVLTAGPEPPATGEADRLAPSLVVTRPTGETERLQTWVDPMRPGVLRSAFVPAAEGVYALAIEGSPDTVGFRALPAAPGAAEDAWARLALLAQASGGSAVARDSLDAAIGHWQSSTTDAGSGESRPLPALIFAVLVAIACAEWATRRLSGRP